MFNSTKNMNASKVYKVSLCTTNNKKLALHGDRDLSYYRSNGGYFYPEDDFKKVADLLVMKSNCKSCVKELATGLEIPFLLFDIMPNYEDGSEFACMPYGDTSNLAFAFAVSPPDSRIVPFMLEEASSEEIEAYLSKTISQENWHGSLLNVLKNAEERKKAFLLEERENRKQMILQKSKKYNKILTENL